MERDIELAPGQVMRVIHGGGGLHVCHQLQGSKVYGELTEKKFEPGNYKLQHLNSFTCASSELLGRFVRAIVLGRIVQTILKNTQTN